MRRMFIEPTGEPFYARRSGDQGARATLGAKAVHRAYSRNAKVTLPPLEDYEKNAAAAQIIPMFLPATE
jgi:hypothetical protein